MRFNDLFATVLSGRSESDWSRAILWRQCIDLLAQYDRGGGIEAADLHQVTETLQRLRSEVPAQQKLSALAELGGRLRSPRLVHLLLSEEPSVVVAAMRNARLADGEWPSIIAESGPLARSVLRERSDLGPEARRALDTFGLNDLSLIDLNADAREVPVEVHPVEDQSQIRRIVDRIERFTSERQERVHRETVEPEPAKPVAAREVTAAFTFLTDADGVVTSANGTLPMQLAGLRLASPSLDRATGPDGQIMGAFRRRGAFREGRLTIGDGPLEGCWLVDGDPLFDQRTGRFKGYRGAARRAETRDLAPRGGVTLVPSDGNGGETGSHSTSLRQLIHELRSPLNGVMGFAELIESQLLGPVGDSYRSMAGNIVDDVRSLVDILDDLDLANRTDKLAASGGALGSDAASLLRDAIDRLGPNGDGQGRIVPDIAQGMPGVDVAPAIAERMIAHFVRALAGCVDTETLQARCLAEGSRVVVEIDRPVAMQGLSDEQLFDSGFEHVMVNMDAPILGVGFALRLVRRLAQANKGGLAVHDTYFALSLPAVTRQTDQEVSS